MGDEIYMSDALDVIATAMKDGRSSGSAWGDSMFPAKRKKDFASFSAQERDAAAYDREFKSSFSKDATKSIWMPKDSKPSSLEKSTSGVVTDSVNQLSEIVSSLSGINLSDGECGKVLDAVEALTGFVKSSSERPHPTVKVMASDNEDEGSW